MEIKSIISKCKSGDAKAREVLYFQTADKIMNICLRYTSDKSLAEDVFQETYLKTFQKIHQFDPEKGKLITWMGKIAVNLALVKLQRRQKWTYTDFSDPAALSPSIKNGVLDQLSSEEIFRHVQELPVGYRLVFNMYAIEGYSHKEIAEQLGITASTSRSQFTRARAILQKKIQAFKKKLVYERTA